MQTVLLPPSGISYSDRRDRSVVPRTGKDRAPQLALATLSHERFYEPGWLYERKLDGERCLARRDGDLTTLVSRSGQDVTGSFPEVADAVAAQPVDGLVLDGEVVAFEGHRTSFARLQQRMQVRDPERARASRVAVYYYIFDLIRCNGEDVTALPLRQRKQLLRSSLHFTGPVRFVPHRNRADEEYFGRICSQGWGG